MVVIGLLTILASSTGSLVLLSLRITLSVAFVAGMGLFVAMAIKPGETSRWGDRHDALYYFLVIVMLFALVGLVSFGFDSLLWFIPEGWTDLNDDSVRIGFAIVLAVHFALFLLHCLSKMEQLIDEVARLREQLNNTSRRNGGQ